MSTIYLLRHGALAENFGKDHYLGCHEVPLSNEGRAQMAAAAGFLATTGTVTLLSSPIGRCLEGAAIIGERLSLFSKKVGGFQEIDLGRWDGEAREAIKKRFPKEYAARGADLTHFRPPEGESFKDLQDRVWPAFAATIKNFRTPMAIVSHAGVNRVILCKLLNQSLDTLFEIKQDYGCINILELEGDIVSCTTLNYRPSLSEFSPTTPYSTLSGLLRTTEPRRARMYSK